METLSLVPQNPPQKLTEGDGGSYYAWNSTIFPLLGAERVTGGRLILQPRGFALPHYSDCNKIGYVIKGTEGVAGMINPTSQDEKIVKLRRGDSIVVHRGIISWWSNDGDDELEIVFLGESHHNNQGEFVYSLLTGALGVLGGFSNKTICKAYNMNEEQANVLTKSQGEALIIKLEPGTTIPKPSKIGHTKKLCFNFADRLPDILIEKGGSFGVLTSEKHPPLQGIELSANLLELDPNATFGPTYYARDSAVVLTYVVRGSGWVQVVGMSGKVLLDIPLKAGQLFAVPKFFMVAIGANDEGIECFSVVTSSEPILSHIAGKTSIWNALPPQIIQASLNISPEFCEQLMEKINKTEIIKPAY